MPTEPPEEARRLYGLVPDMELPKDKRKDVGLRVGVPRDKANVVTSMTDRPGWHMPAIDIDGIDIRLVPSSTEGNFHLFIDKAVTWSDYKRLLAAMLDCGIIEEGYYDASVAKGATALRTGKREIPRDDLPKDEDGREFDDYGDPMDDQFSPDDDRPKRRGRFPWEGF